MNKNLVMALLVPRRGGKQNVGTGYPVSRDRVLTCKHVVCPNDRDESKPIEVLRPNANTAKPHSAHVVWQSAEHDVAVLSLSPAVDDARDARQLLSPHVVSTGTFCESEGFPRATKGERRRMDAHPMSGTVFSTVEHASTMQIQIDSEPEEWAGMSGAPVFVGSVIVGVIETVKAGFRGKRLSVVRSGAFLHDAGFRAAVGFALVDAEVHASLARRLVELTGDRTALAELKRLLQAPHEDAASIAHAVLHHQAIDVVRLLASWNHRLIETGATRPTIARRLLDALVPFCVDWPAVFHDLPQLGKNAYSVRAARLTIAEVISAGLDLRDARFRLDGHDLVGEHLVTLPAQVTLDPEGRQAAEEILGHVAGTFGITSVWPRVRNAQLRGHLTELLRPGPGRRSYYLIVSTDDNGRLSPSLEKALARIQSVEHGVPQLRVLVLHCTPEEAERESAIVARIRDVHTG